MRTDPTHRLHRADVADAGSATYGVVARRRVGAVGWPSRRRRRRSHDRQRRELIRFVRRIERAVRTGATVRHAVQRSFDAGSAELRQRFALARSAMALGRPLSAAFGECAQHAPDAGAAHVATLLAFVAGDARGAAAALASASKMLQSADDLEHERRALIAQAEVSARVLVALPLVGVAIGLLTGQQAATSLFTTGIGRGCLAIGVALDLVGAWWMARLIARASR